MLLLARNASLLLCLALPLPSQAPEDPVPKALSGLLAEHQVPALGAALVTREGLDGAWVAGVRASGGTDAVTVEDRWHLGSCTKSMTATLLALLVERGDLAWDTPLPKLLPELAANLHADFANVTLVDLLAHRAGVLTMTAPEPTLRRCARFDGTPMAQRAELCRAVLTQKPEFAVRAKIQYSNAGFIIAGHIAEVTTKKPWEELMRELLFVPLGMTTAGFGAPGTADACREPRGHDLRAEPVVPGPDADNPPLLGPAGTVHASLGDWARFLQLHLRGVKADVKVGNITLRQATFARMRTAWPGSGNSYGYGFALPKRKWAAGDLTVLTHSGSNGMWHCVFWLDPAAGFGILATTNIGGGGAAKATDAVVSALLRHWQARQKAAAKPGDGGR